MYKIAREREGKRDEREKGECEVTCLQVSNISVIDNHTIIILCRYQLSCVIQFFCVKMNMQCL